MTTIYRIMPDNSVKEFHVTPDVDFSCFFRWDISPKLLKRNNGELLWLLTGSTTSNAVGSERYYTLFEVLEVALAGIELPHVASVKELDIKTIHTALMKAYGEFGYKGCPFQNLLSNFRRSIEFEL